MDAELAAARASQAQRWAAAQAAEGEARAAAGSSRRKVGKAPVKHGRKPVGGAAAPTKVPTSPAAGAAAADGDGAEEEEEEDDDEAAVAAARASLARSLAAPPAALVAPSKRQRVKTCTPAELAVSYYLAADAGGASERLQRSGDAEARLAAAACVPPAPPSARTPAFAAAAGRLTVRYKALRTTLEERLQALSRDQTLEVLAAVLARGGARGSAQHLLAPREMAARSPTAFWNCVRHFGSAEAAAAAARAATS